MVEPRTRVGGHHLRGGGWRHASLEVACWKPHHPALDGKHVSEVLQNNPEKGLFLINKVLLKLKHSHTHWSIIYGGLAVVTKTIQLTKPRLLTSGFLQRMVQEMVFHLCTPELHTKFSYRNDPRAPSTPPGPLRAKPHPSLLFVLNTISHCGPIHRHYIFKCYYSIFILLGFSLKAIHHVPYSHCSLAQGLQVFPRALWLPIVIVNWAVNFGATDKHNERALCSKICFDVLH